MNKQIILNPGDTLTITVPGPSEIVPPEIGGEDKLEVLLKIGGVYSYQRRKGVTLCQTGCNDGSGPS
jgi:hypothetical protein